MEERMKLITWKRTMPSLIPSRRLRERMSWAVVVREKTSQRAATPAPVRAILGHEGRSEGCRLGHHPIKLSYTFPSAFLHEHKKN